MWSVAIFLVENHIFHARTSDHLSAYSENQNSNGHAVLKLYRNSTCLDKCYRLSAIGKKECNRALGCLLWAVAFALTVALVADLADINVGIVVVVVVVVLVDDGVLISLLSLWCSHQSNQTHGKCPSSEPPGPQMECSWRQNKLAKSTWMNLWVNEHVTWAAFKPLADIPFLQIGYWDPYFMACEIIPICKLMRYMSIKLT